MAFLGDIGRFFLGGASTAEVAPLAGSAIGGFFGGFSLLKSPNEFYPAGVLISSSTLRNDLLNHSLSSSESATPIKL